MGQSSEFFKELLPSFSNAAKFYYSIEGDNFVEHEADSTYNLLRTINNVDYADLKGAVNKMADGDSESLLLTDGEYFDAFIKLDEFRRSDPNATGKSDEAIGRQLNKSARQVSKMREIAKKASPELLSKIKNNSISLNKAYEFIKASEKKTSGTSEKENQTGKGINSDSFKLGVLFVLSELERGRKKSQILKDKRIAKLSLSEIKLSEEEVSKIAERFGIA